MHEKTVELREDERTRYEVWVSQDRSSGGRTQSDERPAGKQSWIGTTGAYPEIELDDAERTPCEVWTRVMGYHRPVAAWNPGKKSEHVDRRYYCEPGRADAG